MHLVPGFVNIDQFKDDADIHFFVLNADEEVHKERFVKRAMKIKRGGKHLEYFKENRIINDYLAEQANEHGVPVIYNDEIETTVKVMLTHIRQICKTLTFKHPVDDISDETGIVLKYGGRMEDISYFIHGFTEPLRRKINVYDPKEAERFFSSLEKSKKRKEDLEKIYGLSDNIHSHKLCAPDEESLDKMIKELDEKGYLLKEK